MAQRGVSSVEISEHDRGDVVLVRLSGRLDARSAPDVRLALRRLVVQGAVPVLLDLQEVVLGDAAAVGLLLELHRRSARVGTTLQVVAADDRTARLLHRARLHAMLPPAARVWALSPPDRLPAGAVRG